MLFNTTTLNYSQTFWSNRASNFSSTVKMLWNKRRIMFIFFIFKCIAKKKNYIERLWLREKNCWNTTTTKNCAQSVKMFVSISSGELIFFLKFTIVVQQTTNEDQKLSFVQNHYVCSFFFFWRSSGQELQKKWKKTRTNRSIIKKGVWRWIIN